MKVSGFLTGFRVVHFAGLVCSSVAFFLGLVGFVIGVAVVASVTETPFVVGP